MPSPGEIKAKKKAAYFGESASVVLKGVRGGFRGADFGHEMISITVGDPSFEASKNQAAGQGSAQEKPRHGNVCFAAVLA